MVRVLAFLGGNAIPALFLGVFLGLLLPDLAALARPLLGPCVVILLLATLLRVDWDGLRLYARRPGLGIMATIWLLIASPILVWALVVPLGLLPPALSTALVLMAAAPPILGATSIAIILGLDGALIMVVTLLASLLAPLTIPPLALALLGLQLEVSVLEFTLRLSAVVFLAFAGALVLRRLTTPEWLASRARHIDGLVVVVMVVFAVAIMAGVTDTLIERPGTVALWVLAAFLANPLLQALGALAFVWLGRRAALTIGLASGNCNMGLLMAALPPDSDYDVFLFFALAQLPMYMLPAALSPLYRWAGSPPSSRA